MKPIYLKMTAFASYCGTAEVDFTRLYRSGIFLITGKTGGGKSTILDAICTALYNRATSSVRAGNERDTEWRKLRCVNAPDSRDTEIEFIFSTGDKKYRFYRRWHLPNSRKDERKLTDKENVCEVMRPGSDTWQTIASGNAMEVSKCAENILNLTHNQFVKLIMLPQGEFRELLISKDESKERIFNKLFGTQRWEQITEEIKEEANRMDRLCEEQKNRRIHALEDAGCHSPDELDSEISGAASELDALKMQKEHTAKEAERTAEALRIGLELDGKFAALDKVTERIRSLDALSGENDRKRERLAHSRRLGKALSEYRLMTEAFRTLEKARKEKDAADCEKKKADAALALAKENSGKLPALEKTRDDLAAYGTTLRELAGSKAEYDRKTALLRQHTEQLESSVKRLDELKQSRDTLKERIENGRECLKECEAASQALPEAIQKCAALEKSLAAAKEYELKKSMMAKAQSGFRFANEAAERAHSELDARQKAVELMEQAIRADRAYSLAAGLAEGAPCPVCGSVHHPSPAEPAVSTPTAGQLDSAKKLAEKAGKELERLRSDMARLEQERALLNRDMEEIIAKTGGVPESSELLAERFAAAQAEKNRLDESAKKAGNIRRGINDLDNQQEAAVHDMEKVSTEINNLHIQMESEKTTVHSLSDRLQRQGISGFDELDRTLAAIRRQWRDTVEKIGSLSQALADAQNEAGRTGALLQSAEKSLASAVAEYGVRKDGFAAKCALLGIPEDSDFVRDILDSAEETRIQEALDRYKTDRETARQKNEELLAATEGKIRPDTEALRLAERQARERVSEISGEIGRHTARLENLRNCKKTLDTAEKELESLERRRATAEKIRYWVTNKKGSSTTLLRYVIGIKMDSVIFHADEYLRRLTKGQYSMRRVENGANGKNGSLDIIIQDCAAGSVRAVSTLSGGEMFLASLALALGLSETVQSFSGGVHLDSLFIDEGFGSLDSETLDTAMEAITQVRENKLLGIISHVSELKERIPCRIEVSRTPDGSTLSMKI